MPPEAIFSVYFDSIPCDRAAKVFAPKLQRFTSITLYRFSNNGLHALEQLSALALFPRMLHLEISNNDVISRMPTLLPMVCCHLLPGLITFNGVALTTLDVHRARLCIMGMPRPVGSAALFPPASVNDATLARGADVQTQAMLTHCVTVDKKVRSLEGAWPGMLHRIVTDTVSKLRAPPKHDEIYKMT